MRRPSLPPGLAWGWFFLVPWCRSLAYDLELLLGVWFLLSYRELRILSKETLFLIGQGGAGGLGGGWASGAAAKGGPFHSKYDRLRYFGVLYLVFFDVLGFRFLKNYVCKIMYFTFWQFAKTLIFRSKYDRLRHLGQLYVVFFDVLESRFLKNLYVKVVSLRINEKTYFSM